ncbi:10672_t:CDS:2 [Acaulospora morrowiae]|uniref:10672_t:CDS:1 n=1 Tax=Acaulospora morrowiae TaxID=94023 RepID=A0A9N9A157_9GLOM|nr:10672_t:CDS:2 [Acaulospora morrowiae]
MLLKYSTFKPSRFLLKTRTFFTKSKCYHDHKHDAQANSQELISSWKSHVSNIVVTRHDTLVATPLQLLALTLNRETIVDNVSSTETPPVGTPIPPNYHLAYFLPKNFEKELASDGYGTHYSPPPPFLRRMWAGGEISLDSNNPLLVGQNVTMTTKVRNVEFKIGSSGENVFVWLDKEIHNEKGWSVRDTRCLAYMKDTNKIPDFEKIVLPSEVLLFRFSALTFNSHRIHYDHLYSTKVEGYPRCLVHGPLTCTLLMDLVRDNLPSNKLHIKSFSYRALSPLYVGEEFKICGKKSDTSDMSFEVWAENKEGGVAMRGTAIYG